MAAFVLTRNIACNTLSCAITQMGLLPLFIVTLLGWRQHPAIGLKQSEHVFIFVEPTHATYTLVEAVRRLMRGPLGRSRIVQHAEQKTIRLGRIPILAVLDHGIEQLVELLAVEAPGERRDEFAEVGFRSAEAGGGFIKFDRARPKVGKWLRRNRVPQIVPIEAGDHIEQRISEVRHAYARQHAIFRQGCRVGVVDGFLQGSPRRLLQQRPKIRKGGDKGDPARSVLWLEIIDQPDDRERDVRPCLDGTLPHGDQQGDDLAVLGLPLRRHALEQRFRQQRAKIPYVLEADALKVALLDIVEDSCVRGRKACRLNVDVEKVEDRLALQGFLRQHQVDGIDEVEPHQFR